MPYRIHVTRRNFLGSLAGAGAGVTLLPQVPRALPQAQAAAPRPNIIVILADDLGYADLSAYRINRFQTPNIDRIGMGGVRFTDGYATAPVCGP